MEAIGWLKIAASPFLIGLGIGAWIYFTDPTTTRLVIGASIAGLGLITGIILATKIWRSKEGTMAFLSRISSSPAPEKTETQVRGTDIGKEHP